MRIQSQGFWVRPPSHSRGLRAGRPRTSWVLKRACSRVSDSVGLGGWGLIICISMKFPGEADASGSWKRLHTEQPSRRKGLNVPVAQGQGALLLKKEIEA